MDRNKAAYLLIGIIAILSISLAAHYSGLLNGTFANADAVLSVTVINCIATAVLASVAFVNMTEAKKMRSEMARPRLALEPSFFEYDKDGDVSGFNCLNLCNGGAVARDVEIDIHNGEKISFLYASSIGTNDRVQILNGKSSDFAGVIDVIVRYKNMYNKSILEELSMSIKSINEAKRKLVPVHDMS